MKDSSSSVSSIQRKPRRKRTVAVLKSTPTPAVAVAELPPAMPMVGRSRRLLRGIIADARAKLDFTAKPVRGLSSMRPRLCVSTGRIV